MMWNWRPGKFKFVTLIFVYRQNQKSRTGFGAAFLVLDVNYTLD